MLRPTNQINFDTLFFQLWTSTLNLDSPLSGPILINSAWSSFVPHCYLTYMPLFKWISKLIKLFSNIAYLFMNYARYLSSKSLLYLSLVIGLEATIGGPWRIPVLPLLAFPPKKVTADLAGNEGLISSLKGRVWVVKSSSAEDGDTTFSSEINPWEFKGSKFSA